jgi:hypothetical protein
LSQNKDKENNKRKENEELFIWGCGIKYVPNLVDATPWSNWKATLREPKEEHTLSPLKHQRLQEYTQMHLFDFIIANHDRYRFSLYTIIQFSFSFDHRLICDELTKSKSLCILFSFNHLHKPKFYLSFVSRIFSSNERERVFYFQDS